MLILKLLVLMFNANVAKNNPKQFSESESKVHNKVALKTSEIWTNEVFIHW